MTKHEHHCLRQPIALPFIELSSLRDKPSRRYVLLEGCRTTPVLGARILRSYVSAALFSKRERA